MASDILLALPSACNDASILFDGEVNGQPAILSTRIANHFNKKHQHVLRDIDMLQSILPQSFCAANFMLTYIDVPGPNGANRKSRAYLLTRDAFSLLAMGLSGKAAVIWKLRYIEAFNAMERAALEGQSELARQAGYMQGKEEALSLPVMESERKKAYLEGMKEGEKLAAKNDRFLALQKIAGYIGKGLTHSEIGKLLGLSKSAISARVARAKKLGFWPDANRNIQAKLPGVE